MKNVLVVLFFNNGKERVPALAQFLSHAGMEGWLGPLDGGPQKYAMIFIFMSLSHQLGFWTYHHFKKDTLANIAIEIFMH